MVAPLLGCSSAAPVSAPPARAVRSAAHQTTGARAARRAAAAVRRGPARGAAQAACLFLINLVPGSQAAYFYVEEGHEKCFNENILKHQVLRMTYSMHDKEVLDKGKETSSECKIKVSNPDGKVVKEHALVSDNHQGVLAHAAQVPGEHSICLTCQPQEWFGRRKMRWSIAFDILGESSVGAPDLQKVASMNQLQSTQAGVEELIERISAISTENEYEKTFEGQFVRASDAVNTDVAAFKLVQVLLITIVTAFQIHHLSRFLQRHRLFDCGGCLPFASRPSV